MSGRAYLSGGIVALCACSIVLALVTIVHNLPVNNASVDPAAFSPTSVNFSPGGQYNSSALVVPLRDANGRVVYVPVNQGNGNAPVVQQIPAGGKFNF